MDNKDLKWEVLNKFKVKSSKLKVSDIVDILLRNRGIKTKKEKEEFFKPTLPYDLSLEKLELNKVSLRKAVDRIKKSIQRNEEILIYGDYDADGICATAILWECLYSLTKNVKPYIPSRFEEGYGMNPDTISKLSFQNPNLKLIISVDNGIVAENAVKKANELGIDVIVTDHHQKGRKLPLAYSIIHTDKISGSGIAFIFAREIIEAFKGKGLKEDEKGWLELAAIGTIADQMTLIGPNRSFAKYGLFSLERTKRPGLLALFEEAGLGKEPKIGTYEVNFIIAPRINATGRLRHAIDSLRLLCTKSVSKAKELAYFLGKINKERQKIVDEVVNEAKETVYRKNFKGAIVLASESYHEGVIGLAAAKLVEEFYRPAIVMSRGEKISKASARSISGFNIIESIRRLEGLILGGGGHPMAAGFSIETEKIDFFREKFEEVSYPLLTEDVLTRRLKIDLELDFDNLSLELAKDLARFEPTGIGNPTPIFSTRSVNVIDAKTLGNEGKHLRLVLESKGKVVSAIAFGKGELFPKLSPSKKIDLAYNLGINSWNASENVELRIKDMKV